VRRRTEPTTREYDPGLAPIRKVEGIIGIVRRNRDESDMPVVCDEESVPYRMRFVFGMGQVGLHDDRFIDCVRVFRLDVHREVGESWRWNLRVGRTGWLGVIEVSWRE